MALNRYILLPPFCCHSFPRAQGGDSGERKSSPSLLPTSDRQGSQQAQFRCFHRQPAQEDTQRFLPGVRAALQPVRPARRLLDGPAEGRARATQATRQLLLIHPAEFLVGGLQPAAQGFISNAAELRQSGEMLAAQLRQVVVKNPQPLDQDLRRKNRHSLRPGRLSFGSPPRRAGCILHGG